MPNHVTTRCIVTGPQPEIARFRELIFRFHDGDQILDFNEVIPMPSPTNVSFDPQFGSERVVEKARLVAGELVDKLKAFTRKKRGG